MPIDIRDTSVSFREAALSGKELWETALAESGGEQEQAGAPSTTPVLFSLSECREEYVPIDYPGSAEGFFLPADFARIYKEAETEQIAWMIGPSIETKSAEIAASGGDIVSLNSLGVLHARYEQYGKARTKFQQVLLSNEFMPALLNMGNIHYLKDELKLAQPFYERASAVAPFDSRVILALAKVNHKLENYGSARDGWEKLKSLDPELAETFRYLNLMGEEAVRAARELEDRDVVVWIDE
ncbi:MAG: hypothetical protein K9L68_14175 [Spirochaetales bacterium]|nr:hypothetical protein [Spirochaetales bacterium]MCF7939740.1 hypothetical protein [Spirochaetales bacterium]